MKYLVAILIIVAFAAPTSADNPFAVIDRKFEQWKLKKNAEGADHDIDCKIERRSDGPWCTIHETYAYEVCPKLTRGNFRTGSDVFTDCFVTRRDGAVFCAEHERYDCPYLQLVATQLRQIEVAGRMPRDHSTPQCIKVLTLEGEEYCSFHDNYGCFKLSLPCRQHPGKMCGIMRPGSLARPDQVPIEDGVIEKSLLVIKTTHTAYVWGDP